MGNTKVEMVVTIVANLANIGFNWVFIYGRFSLPEMGAEGAGLGTLLSRIIAPILMVGYFYSRERYRGYLDGFSPRNYSWATVKNCCTWDFRSRCRCFSKLRRSSAPAS